MIFSFDTDAFIFLKKKTSSEIVNGRNLEMKPDKSLPVRLKLGSKLYGLKEQGYMD